MTRIGRMLLKKGMPSTIRHGSQTVVECPSVTWRNPPSEKTMAQVSVTAATTTMVRRRSQATATTVRASRGMPM